MKVGKDSITLINEKLKDFCLTDKPGTYNNCSIEVIDGGESRVENYDIRVMVSQDVFEVLISNRNCDYVRELIKNCPGN